MNNTQDGNPLSHLPIRYTKDLHLLHVQACWDGNLQQFNPFTNFWEKPAEPPLANSTPTATE